jgi:hypothetical protein
VTGTDATLRRSSARLLYSSGVSVSDYASRIEIWNTGLPDELRIADLKRISPRPARCQRGPKTSRPRPTFSKRA